MTAKKKAEELRSRLQGQRFALRAVRQWLQTQGAPLPDEDEPVTQAVADALVQGIQHPLIRLESACFWKVVPSHA